jgi:DNA-binding CsgD family transcriptional regulator
MARYTQAEIALKLGISRRTVEHHAARIRAKTGAETTRAASRAHGHGRRSNQPVENPQLPG